MDITSSEGTVTYRCRKCRQLCDINAAVQGKAKGCELRIPHDSHLVHLDIEQCPEWITAEVQKLNWTKGKLTCVKCRGRLGSFDFLRVQPCPCGSHKLPPVHLLKDRLDIIRTSSNAPSPNPVSNRAGGTLSLAGRAYNGRNNNCQNSQEISNFRDAYDHKMAESTYDNLRDSFGPLCASSMDSIDDVAPAQNSLVHHSRCCDSDMVSSGCTSEKDSAVASQCRSSDNQPLSDVCSQAVHRGDLKQVLLQETSCARCSNKDVLEHTEKRNTKSVHVYNQERSKKALPSIRKREHRRRRQNARILEIDEDIDMSTYNPYGALLVEEVANNDGNGDSDCDNTGLPHEQTELEDEREDVPYEWTCCVCMELYHQPHTCSPCGHIYCDPCLRLLCKSATNRQVLCPLCRHVIMECKPNDELQQRIEENFPKMVTERAKRVKQLGGIKSIPLPRCSVVQQLQTGGGWSVFRLASLGPYLRRFLLLFLLFVCHNLMSFISSSLVSLPYTRHPGAFNDYLWWVTKMMLRMYVLQCVKFPVWTRHLRAFLILLLPFVYICSENMIRFAVNATVLCTLV